MHTSAEVFLRVVVLLVTCVLASAASSIPRLTATSDVIVVARIVGGRNTPQSRELEFIVDRVLMGNLQPGVFVRASFLAVDRAARASMATTLETGLIFLKQAGNGSFNLVSAESGELGLRGAYLPLPPGQPASFALTGTPLEAVYAELVGGIERGATDEQYLRRIIAKLSPADSSFVATALQRWSESPAAPLRLLAIGSLVGAGSAEAVVALRADLMKPSPTPLARAAGSSLFAFRNSDPRAVVAIGEIARSSGSSREVQEAAAAALQSIHTRESLPALRSLLDSSNALVRQFAIGGLSAFALQMRIPKDSVDAMEALDEVLNPGRRRKLPAAEAPYDTEETRQFAHFGPFRDPADEARYLAFWKNWCERNFALIMVP